MSHFTYPLTSYLAFPSRQIVLARSAREAEALLREHRAAFGRCVHGPQRAVLPLGMTRLFSERS